MVLSLLSRADGNSAAADCSAELSLALSQICPGRVDFKSNIAVMKLLKGQVMTPYLSGLCCFGSIEFCWVLTLMLLQKKEAWLAMRQLISTDKRNCLILNNYAVLLMQRAELVQGR